MTSSDKNVMPEPRSHLYIEDGPVALCGHERGSKEIDEGDSMKPERREQRYFDCAECWDRFREMPDA